MRRVFAVAALLLTAAPAAAADYPIIDTHAHLEYWKLAGSFAQSMNGTLATMDRLGIRMSIIEPPPMVGTVPIRYDCEKLRFLVKEHPDRFRISGGSELNIMIHDIEPGEVTDRVKARFREKANEVLACGVVGFGELAAHHLSIKMMGDLHPYEWTPPDHPLLLLLADIAAEKGIPIDLHVDLVPEDMPMPHRPIFNPANPQTLKANLDGFERLLDHNKNARIIWAHAGSDPLLTKTPQVIRRLMGRHANLYASIRLAPRGLPPPAMLLDRQLNVKPAWKALLRDFPDRFVLGSDQFHSPSTSPRRTPVEGIEYFAKLLDQLPPDLARAVAFENAERLFKLNP